MKQSYIKINEFFEKCPFLIFSLSFISAILVFLFQSYFLIIFFFLSLLFYKKYYLVILFFLFGSIFSIYHLKKIAPIPLKGQGIFEILSIKKIATYSTFYSYKINIQSFQTKDKAYKNIKAYITSKKRLKANFLYNIEGEINKRNNSLFLKKPKITQNRKKLYSIVEIRYFLKNKLFLFLKKNIKNKNSSSFLHTLLTSDNHSNFISYIFSLSGLSHTLAISGFHFGILILFFSFILDIFFSKKISFILLISIAISYFLFVGPIASVMRSFIMIILFLVAKLINRKYFAINSLCFAFLVILLIDPYFILNVGFQLSFLASLSILLIHPIIYEFLNKFINNRNELEKKEFNFLDKFLYKILIYLKGAISISLSVNVLIFPLLLYHFNKFPVMSLAYNLIVPFLIFILMVLLLSSIFLSFLPFLSNFLFYILNIFTSFTLKLIINFPKNLEFFIRTKEISKNLVIIYISLCIIFFIFLKIFYIDKEANDYLKIV
jgi:competence protein ComEC